MYREMFCIIQIRESLANVKAIMVSKSQKQILKVSFEPKRTKPGKYFCISALAL